MTTIAEVAPVRPGATLTAKSSLGAADSNSGAYDCASAGAIALPPSSPASLGVLARGTLTATQTHAPFGGSVNSSIPGAMTVDPMLSACTIPRPVPRMAGSEPIWKLSPPR